jgi:hypothetical protein
VAQQKAEVRRKLKERRVPSSALGRVMGFAQLGARLVYGSVSDQVSQYFRGGSNPAGQQAGTPTNRCLPCSELIPLVQSELHGGPACVHLETVCLGDVSGCLLGRASPGCR